MNGRPSVLLDTNVIVAAIVDTHSHHTPSFALFGVASEGSLAVAAHTYAEAYSVLTTASPRAPYRWPPDETWAALARVAASARLVGLSSTQTLDCVRQYSVEGGVGARLCDKLIGEAAAQNGIGTILTWNVKHMSGLFPTLTVIDPNGYAKTAPRKRGRTSR